MPRSTVMTITLALGLLAPVVGSAAADAETQATPCCFANPRYAGICQVAPGEGETCSSILNYLNNIDSTGKTYCGNTTVREGWSRVECTSEGGGTSQSVCSAAGQQPDALDAAVQTTLSLP
jgi:hypothetical protein